MKFFKPTVYLTAIILLLFSCKKDVLIEGGSGLEDWSASTHGYGATPNYGVVFNQNEVLRLDFVIDPEYWEAMQNDVAAIYANTGGGGGGFGGGLVDETPIYIPAQMFFNGKQWYDIGLRYKGNSSLQTAYLNGSGKLPLRIEMDHFANENPNINGQTFYGFTQLALSSNFNDNSLIHEKVAADVFRDFGVPAPQSAFCRVFVDFGEGPTYFGLYTLLEVVFDPSMLNAQFGASYGNCYKPDGAGAHMNDLNKIDGTSFPNKTNQGASLDDINSLVNALLDDTRTSNPALWRSELETILDMDQYLKYLAANTTMTNWDTYGTSPHNFYIYHNPSNNKLVWIPWDNNQMFESASLQEYLEFDFSNLSVAPFSPSGEVSWPMITYIYNDPVYKTRYDQYIDEFITTAFTSSKMTSRFTNATNMVQPYVTGVEGEITGYTNLNNAGSFESSLTSLLNFVSTRITEAEDYTP
jgi:spore coat protein H